MPLSFQTFRQADLMSRILRTRTSDNKNSVAVSNLPDLVISKKWLKKGEKCMRLSKKKRKMKNLKGNCLSHPLQSLYPQFHARL